MSNSKVAAANDSWAPEPTTGVRRRATSGYTRVRTIIENRTAILRTRPAPANAAGELSPLPDTKQVNPFDHAPEQVPPRTQRLCACPLCAEPGCDCWLCSGSGRVEAWVEILVSQRQQVTVSGSGAALEQHVAVDDPRDFERTEWPNQLLHQTWYRRVPEQLASVLRPTLDPVGDRVLWVQVQVFVG